MAICSRCGNKWKMSESNTCPICKEKWEKKRAKEYDTHARNKESAKVYQSSKWKKIREKVLIRDGFQCVKCGAVVGIKPKDHAVDHVVELVDNGPAFDMDNLELLCQACHNTKSAQERKKRENHK